MKEHKRQPGKRPQRSHHRTKPTRRAKPAARPVRLTLRVQSMGRGGDGMARTEERASDARLVPVPFTLPAETVDADVADARGTLQAVLDASPERREPLCRHHGRAELDHPCGSCALQHWRTEPYRAWKRGLLVSALERAGLEAEVDPLVPCPTGARRRLVLAARRTDDGVVLGFNTLRSDRIVDMAECSVAQPELVAALPHLRAILPDLIPSSARARITLLLTETGIDMRVDAETSAPHAMPSLPKTIVRLSWGDEVLLERSVPVLQFGSVAVTPPPGGFVQAVAEAEQAMADLVTAHLSSTSRALDLFAGSGTFALRLAATMSVHAVEGEAAPLRALDRAWRGGQRLRHVTTERRDLMRRPLMANEIDGTDRPGAKPFDAAVIDPPRAGAEAQSRQLARSGARRVAMVSCNPVTLARDLAIMLDGTGFRLDRVVPIDQFVFTPHLEAVALLRRD